jgi:uncharacterized glyoxalase superfamily protein PhnB
MTTPETTNRPAPDGYGTVTPWIISKDTAGLIDFLTQAFDATELARVPNEDGTIGHAEVRIGDSVVMMFDGRPDWSDSPAYLRLYVEDGDATYAQALDAGASSVTEVTELFWGDRVGRVRDPFGNVWWIQQRAADLTADEIMQRSTDPEFIEAMRYVQSAQIVAPAVSTAR